LPSIEPAEQVVRLPQPAADTTDTAGETSDPGSDS